MTRPGPPSKTLPFDFKSRPPPLNPATDTALQHAQENTHGSQIYIPVLWRFRVVSQLFKMWQLTQPLDMQHLLCGLSPPLNWAEQFLLGRPCKSSLLSLFLPSLSILSRRLPPPFPPHRLPTASLPLIAILPRHDWNHFQLWQLQSNG